MLLIQLLACSLSVSVAQELAPTHKIDLADPPLHRFDKLVPQYLTRVKVLLDGFKAQMPAIAFDALITIADGIDHFIGQPYADEMRGMSLISGMPLGDVVLLNVFYELVSGCTSIIALNKQNNSVSHARNLDFNIPHLGPVTTNLEVYRNNTYLYTFTTFAGYVGVLTGMKPATSAAAGWTFSLDQRNIDGEPVAFVLNALEAFLLGGRVTTLHVRDMMDRTGTPQEVSPEHAVTELTSTHFTAPSYLIVGASTGGVVITRDRSAAADVWRLSTLMVPPALVETNYDHWKQVPADDDRRVVAYHELNQSSSSTYGPQFLVENVLTVPPVRNEWTVYSTTMELATAYYATYIWKWDV